MIVEGQYAGGLGEIKKKSEKGTTEGKKINTIVHWVFMSNQCCNIVG